MLIWSRKWDGYPLLSKTWQQTSPGNSVYQKMEISLCDFPVPSVVTRGLKAAIFQGREALKEVLEQWRLRGSWSGESVFQRCSGIQWDGFDQKSKEPWGSENPLPTWNQLFVWTFEPSVFFWKNSLHWCVGQIPSQERPPSSWQASWSANEFSNPRSQNGVSCSTLALPWSPEVN